MILSNRSYNAYDINKKKKKKKGDRYELKIQMALISYPGLDS